MGLKWIPPSLAFLCFGIGAVLFFSAKATYEGFEVMTAMTVAILCWPALLSLFTWRMPVLALLIITPISLLLQCLAVKEQIWVYGTCRFYLGQVHGWGLAMPWMEVVFYFLFPIFQLGIFSFCYRHFPPRVITASWSHIFPAILFLVPLSFAAQGIYFRFHPWQGTHGPIDWNCAIMGIAFFVALLTYRLSLPYRLFLRSFFFATWTLAMGAYMLLWEWFHTVWHDHWRYVLGRCLFPPWIIVDPQKGLGLSQAQLYGYFMTATVFPALTFLVTHIWKKARNHF